MIHSFKCDGCQKAFKREQQWKEDRAFMRDILDRALVNGGLIVVNGIGRRMCLCDDCGIRVLETTLEMANARRLADAKDCDTEL